MHREAKGVFSFPYTFFDGVRLQYVRGVSQNMQVRLAAAPRLHTCSHALQTDVQSSSSPPRTVGSERKADEEGWRCLYMVGVSLAGLASYSPVRLLR